LATSTPAAADASTRTGVQCAPVGHHAAQRTLIRTWWDGHVLPASAGRVLAIDAAAAPRLSVPGWTTRGFGDPRVRPRWLGLTADAITDADGYALAAGTLIGRHPSATVQPIPKVRVTHMKTTIELPDDLLERGKAVARRENSTLKALIEEGLRLALRERTRKRAAQFSVQPFQGDGLSAEFDGAGWEKVRDEIYRDRG
jgi:hypothetical protein